MNKQLVRRILMSALGVDVTEQILRKIDIVDHRPPRCDKPKR